MTLSSIVWFNPRFKTDQIGQRAHAYPKEAAEVNFRIQSSFTKMIPQQNDTFYFNFRNNSIRENDTFSKMILFEDL